MNFSFSCLVYNAFDSPGLDVRSFFLFIFKTGCDGVEAGDEISNELMH